MPEDERIGGSVMVYNTLSGINTNKTIGVIPDGVYYRYHEYLPNSTEKFPNKLRNISV